MEIDATIKQTVIVNPKYVIEKMLDEFKGGLYVGKTSTGVYYREVQVNGSRSIRLEDLSECETEYYKALLVILGRLKQEKK